MDIKRYTNLPFPDYRFRSGQNPHPTEDPTGHSFGLIPENPPLLTAQNWSHHTAYLYGVDLFNQQYWWEAHESWESIWRLYHRTHTTAMYLQGLIRLSAAYLKSDARQRRGMLEHYTMATALLGDVLSEHVSYMGLDLMAYLADLHRAFRPVVAADAWPPVHDTYPYLQLEQIDE